MCGGNSACRLHYGCAGVSENTYKHKSAAKKRDWKCEDCRKEVQDVTKGEQNVVIHEMRQLMADFSVKMRKLDQVLCLQKTVEELKESVQYMSATYDKLVLELQQKTETVRELNKAVKDLSEDNLHKNKKIRELEIRLNDSDQYSRNRNIEIAGLEHNENEDLGVLVKKLAGKLNITEFTLQDIDIMHRVPAKNEKVPPKIVVQFKTRTKRNMWLANKRHGLNNGDVTGSRSTVPVYINEHLTPYWKELLWLAKQRAREINFKLVWFRDGKLFMKKDFTSQQIFRIHHADQLSNLTGN